MNHNVPVFGDVLRRLAVVNEAVDLTEGGEDFELVRRLELELPVLGDKASGAEVYGASKVHGAFASEQLAMFAGAKVWAK